MARLKNKIDYSPEIARNIAKLRASGETIQAICKRPGIWGLDQHYEYNQKHKEYSELMDQAQRDYAATLFDRATEIAEAARKCKDPKLIPALRLSFDALSYAAARADPARFSPTSQVHTTTQVENYADVLTRLSESKKGEGPKRTPITPATPSAHPGKSVPTTH